MSRHLYPFSLGIAVAISTQPGSVERSFIGQAQEISTLTDFYSRFYYVYKINLEVLIQSSDTYYYR